MKSIKDTWTGGHWLDLYAGRPTRSVTVNGKQHEVPRGYLKYDDIARLAGMPDNKELTVVCRTIYRGRPGSTTLGPDDSIIARNEMNFIAVVTGAA